MSCATNEPNCIFNLIFYFIMLLTTHTTSLRHSNDQVLSAVLLLR